LEAHYELRPSAWIEPIGDWGDGSIRLVQLPAGTEYGDNIVAFWVPATRPVVGHPIQLSYRIVWSLGEPGSDGLARVVNTREGDLHNVPRGRLFWVDFTDENFAHRDGAALEAEIEVGDGGRVRHHGISPYPQIGGWRVAIETDAVEPGRAISLRCRLRANGQPISETWVYSWKS
jgi:glucans biosynthesis protein